MTNIDTIIELTLIFLTSNPFGIILVNILSSFLFIFVLLFILKPRINISDFICVQIIDNQKYYLFKIVNNSYFNAYNIEFILQERIPYIVDGIKVNHRMNEIPLSINRIYSIPARRKEKGYGEHAILIRTSHDLSCTIDMKNRDFQLTVSAKHGLSNLTKVFKKRYPKSKCIHEGEFKFGTNTGID